MNRCRECKKPIRHGVYCCEKCQRIYNGRKYKIRHGLISRRLCPDAGRLQPMCITCTRIDCSGCPAALIRPCALSRRNSKGYCRMICPADCRECPHNGK